MVKGRDSRSEGCGFESRHRILDGHFSTYICSKNCNDVYLKKTENKRKRPGLAHFLKKKKVPGNGQKLTFKLIIYLDVSTIVPITCYSKLTVNAPSNCYGESGFGLCSAAHVQFYFIKY